MSGTATISGVISGLDTDNILAQMESIAKVSVYRLQSKKAILSDKLSAWQAVNTQLLSLKTLASELSYASAFADKTASSDNESIITATASSSAVAGTYSFTVDSLATTHSIKSQGYAEEGSSVGSGTVSITVGSGEATVIDVSDLSLAGLRDAINTADAGVRAYIINDGSGTDPYKLILASESSGTAGEITMQVNLTGGTAPTFTDLQAAADATLTMGSGLTITRNSNTITDLIPGVTLDLHAAAPASSVTISVDADRESIQEKISEFVAKYNEIIDYLEAQWAYDSESETSGTLFGEYTLHQIQSNMADCISNSIVGLPSSLSLLSQVGITLGTDGKLSLNESELEEALASDFDGVAKLFARFGEASDANVAFITATGDTVPSGETGYAVDITQAATQARVTAGAAQTTALAADEVLTINGVNISLTAGMTQQEVIDAINDANVGVIASATGADGTGTGQYLTLLSKGYGAATEVTGISSVSNATSDTSGIGNVLVTEDSPTGETGTGTGAAGVDVAGTINGEAAEGSGQILTSTTGDANCLQLLITATAAGSYGNIVYSCGAGGELNDLLGFLTETGTGTVQVSIDTLEERIEELDEDITKAEESVERQMERMRMQFNMMEQALAKLQSQGSYLSSQLAQIQANWKGA